MWVKCPLEVALQRNCSRTNSIAQSTITKMDTNFEIANADKFPWESNNLIFNNIDADHDSWLVEISTFYIQYIGIGNQYCSYSYL